MNLKHNCFGISSQVVEPHDWDVGKDVASWIIAGTHAARKSCIVSFTVPYSVGLLEICDVVTTRVNRGLDKLEVAEAHVDYCQEEHQLFETHLVVDQIQHQAQQFYAIMRSI